MSEFLSQGIGVIGSIGIAYCYLANEKGWLTRDSNLYYWLNLISSILLTISLVYNFNLGGFLIEVFWIWISVAGLIRIRKEKLNNHTSK